MIEIIQTTVFTILAALSTIAVIAWALICIIDFAGRLCRNRFGYWVWHTAITLVGQKDPKEWTLHQLAWVLHNVEDESDLVSLRDILEARLKSIQENKN